MSRFSRFLQSVIYNGIVAGTIFICAFPNPKTFFDGRFVLAPLLCTLLGLCLLVLAIISPFLKQPVVRRNIKIAR
jgi:hypothetical protein